MEIVHAGGLNEYRNPRPFLDGLHKFLDSYPKAARLTMIGARWKKLPALIRDLHLHDDVELMPPLDYLDSLAALRSADVLLLLGAAFSEGIFLPSKFPDYCWAGRPILPISPRNGEVARYISQIGASVTPADSPPAELVRVLKSLPISAGILTRDSCLTQRSSSDSSMAGA